MFIIFSAEATSMHDEEANLALPSVYQVHKAH